MVRSNRRERKRFGEKKQNGKTGLARNNSRGERKGNNNMTQRRETICKKK
jgi:hypothetical protein